MTYSKETFWFVSSLFVCYTFLNEKPQNFLINPTIFTLLIILLLLTVTVNLIETNRNENKRKTSTITVREKGLFAFSEGKILFSKNGHIKSLGMKKILVFHVPDFAVCKSDKTKKNGRIFVLFIFFI